MCSICVKVYKTFNFQSTFKKEALGSHISQYVHLHRMDLFTKYFIINARFPNKVSMDCLEHVNHVLHTFSKTINNHNQTLFDKRR